MEAKAKLRFLRSSPKKVRAVADVIRGLGVQEAQHQLQFANRAAARPLLKLLNSAIANAENSYDLEKSNLYIKEIRVDQGPTLKRWRPRAFGRATPIRKRSSHINLILAEKVPSQGKQKEKAKVAVPILVKHPKDLPKESVEAPADKKEEIRKTEKEASEIFDARRLGKHRPPELSGKKKARKGLGRIKSFFNRKAV